MEIRGHHTYFLVIYKGVFPDGKVDGKRCESLQPFPAFFTKLTINPQVPTVNHFFASRSVLSRRSPARAKTKTGALTLPTLPKKYGLFSKNFLFLTA
jgi:hypothetical protein